MAGKVLVTGASGFIGSRTARALLERGYEVIPLIMKGERTELPGAVMGDITDQSSLVIPPCDGIVHCAGLLESGGHGAEKMRRVNFEGTMNLFEKALSSGAKGFIFISSISATGPQGKKDRPITERTPSAPADEYGRSKLDAEVHLRERSKGTGVKVTVLRPSVIYGPGMGEGTSAMSTFKAVLSRKMPLVSGGKSSLNMLYVDNLVQAIMLALEKGEGFSVYNISEGPYSQREVIEAIERHSHGKGGHIRVPRPFLFAAALVLESMRPLLKGPPPLTWTRYKALTSDVWLMDSSKAERELGFVPMVALDEGVRRTMEHYGW